MIYPPKGGYNYRTCNEYHLCFFDGNMMDFRFLSTVLVCVLDTFGEFGDLFLEILVEIQDVLIVLMACSDGLDEDFLLIFLLKAGRFWWFLSKFQRLYLNLAWKIWIGCQVFLETGVDCGSDPIFPIFCCSFESVLCWLLTFPIFDIFTDVQLSTPIVSHFL